MLKLFRIYNYPWSGKLGRIAKRCLYCGTDGPYFRVSSHGEKCTRCNSNQAMIPELVAEHEKEYHRLATEWCIHNGMDYDSTVRELAEKHKGPPDQHRDVPEDCLFLPENVI